MPAVATPKQGINYCHNNNHHLFGLMRSHAFIHFLMAESQAEVSRCLVRLSS